MRQLVENNVEIADVMQLSTTGVIYGSNTAFWPTFAWTYPPILMGFEELSAPKFFPPVTLPATSPVGTDRNRC